MVVRGGCPQTDDVCTEVLDKVSRVNTVAQGLVHCTALAVNHPAVGQNLLEGSALIQCANRSQKAGLEPTTVLVSTFQIDIGRPQFGCPVHQGCKVSRAGVKPAVQRVGFLGEGLAATVGAGEAFGSKLHRFLFKPNIGTEFIKQSRDLCNRFGGGNGLAAVFAVEYGDGQTPAALTGNTPVGTLTDHAGHPVLAPGRIPLNIFNSLHSLILKGFHTAEPLRGCTKDGRLLAAVVVGVGVDDIFGSEQHTAFLHIRKNDGVAFFCFQTSVLAGVIGVAAVVVHGNHQLNAVAHTGVIVISTKAGGGVNKAGAGFHSDILCIHQQRGLVQEGMLCNHVLKELTGVSFHDLIVLKAAGLHGLFHQSFCHDIGFTIVSLYQRIAVTGMQANTHIAGQSPNGGGPNNEEGLGKIKTGKLALIVLHGELHIDGGTGIVLVLDISFCNGSCTERTPADRLQALVDIALVKHPAKDLDFLCFKMLVHGAIGIFPIAHNTQPLEAAHLFLDEVLGKVSAGAAEFGDGHILVQLLLGCFDGTLNGQAVVIPAGHIGGVEAHHSVAADDKVLQSLVQRMTHVNEAVAEGRAIVENEGGQILVLFQHQLVKLLFIPAVQHTRFTVGKTGFHRKVCFWRNDCIFIIHWKLPPY